MPQCARCNSDKRTASKCGGCEMVWYCDKGCQKAHWLDHKGQCKELKAEATAKSLLEEEKASMRKAAARTKIEEEEEEQEVTFNPNTERGNCWTCGADNPHNVCNRCKVAKYCNEACQSDNWFIHKGKCKDCLRQAATLDEGKAALKSFGRGTYVVSQDELDELLHLACGIGRVLDLQRIIAGGGNVSRADPDNGHIPLHMAAQGGHFRIIETLVQHGAFVEGARRDGSTALYIASQHGNLRAVETLIRLGAQVNRARPNGYTPCHIAAEQGHAHIVEALVRNYGAVVDGLANGCSVIRLAARTCLTEMRHGRSVVESARLQIVSFLLERGSPIDQLDHEGGSLLFDAVQDSQTEMVALLLKQGATVDLADNIGVTPLFACMQGGSIAILRLLLQAQANVNHKSNDRLTPLFVASRYGHHLLIEELIRHGAFVNAQDSANRIGTPIYVASEMGQLKAVAALLEHGAQVDLTMDDATGPLFIASQNNHPEVVALLLQKGAQVDLPSKMGVTPLYISAQRGHAAVVGLLLQAGADPHLRNMVGVTPRRVAEHNRHSEVVALLDARIAEIEREEKEEGGQGAATPYHRCTNCRADKATSRCAGCQTVWYCGRECQAAHWKAHKVRCKELKDGVSL